jgi:hypothetical protein
MACAGCSKAAGATGASKAGRVIYVLIFALTAFLAFVGGTWAPQLLSWVPVLDLCSKVNCMGELVVFRMLFGLALFHIIMSLVMIGVRDSTDMRFSFQNEWWIVKVLALVALIVIGFVIPTPFFTVQHGPFVFCIHYVAGVGLDFHDWCCPFHHHPTCALG